MQSAIAWQRMNFNKFKNKKLLSNTQTLNRARPFARRARMTAAPPRVFIRTRNPCVRFLLITEG